MLKLRRSGNCFNGDDWRC